MLSDNFDDAFSKFFKEVSIKGTYAYAFLYALADIGQYDNENLVGRRWIRRNNGVTILNLDFIAIRFIKYYLEILDTDIQHVSRQMAIPNDNLNIISILKNHRPSDVPLNLNTIMDQNYDTLKKLITGKSIKPEVLKYFSENIEGLYEIIKRKNSIKFKSSLIDYMKNNSFKIKNQSQEKATLLLEKLNDDPKPFSSNISEDNPFYTFVHNHNLFAEIYDNRYSTKNDIKWYQNEIEKIPNDVSVKLVERIKKIRAGQEKFRKNVLNNYNNVCAICGLKIKELLEASHIISVKNQSSSGSMDNGICLCVLHHKMFDKGYLYFDENYKIKLSKSAQESEILRNSFNHQNKISGYTIPPSKDYLEKHRQRFGFTNSI